MHLRLGGSGTNSRPAHQIPEVIHGERAQGFGGQWQPHGSQIQEQAAGATQTLMQIACTRALGVVQQPFPTHRGPRLFQVGPHNDKEAITDFIRQGFQLFPVFECGHLIVDGAGPHDDQRSRVAALQNPPDCLPVFIDLPDNVVAGRHLKFELRRRWQNHFFPVGGR